MIWLLPVLAFIVGLPMFFEVGLIILVPIIAMVAQKTKYRNGATQIFIAIPVIATLATMNGMVPPHPVPLLAVVQFQTGLGKTMAYGLVSAIPAIIVAGPLYTKWITSRKPFHSEEPLSDSNAEPVDNNDLSMSTAKLPTVLIIVLLPVILMVGSALMTYFLPTGSVLYWTADFIGTPSIALLIGLLAAMIVLGYGRGMVGREIRESLDESVKAIGGILMIVAGGGAFGQVLQDADIGTAIVNLATHFSFPPIILGWVVAALLAIATGSTTVSVVGATGILKPLVAGDPSVDASLVVIAVGSGSLFFNFINHGSFWLVNKSLHLNLADTVKVHTVTRSIVSVIGLGMVLLIQAVIS